MITKTTLSGVLLLDKPQGMTSQQAVSRVKYLLKSPYHDSKKAGHTGTLDPMATGLLPICLGEATKFSHYQLEAIKSYQAIIRLGMRTDTGDAEGQLTATAEVPTFTQKQLDQICERFLGKQAQIPPMYSALKKDGKKLYELARAGLEIEREPREIELFDFALKPLSDDQLQLTVTCSKGTYVRVLSEDIAKALGTIGHLTALQRIGTGDFSLNNAITLADFEALSLEQRLAKLLAVDACVARLPSLVLDEPQSRRVLQGQRLNVKTQADAQHLFIKDTQEIRLFNPKNVFLGVATIQTNGRLQPTKLVNL